MAKVEARRWLVECLLGRSFRGSAAMRLPWLRRLLGETRAGMLTTIGTIGLEGAYMFATRKEAHRCRATAIARWNKEAEYWRFVIRRFRLVED